MLSVIQNPEIPESNGETTLSSIIGNDDNSSADNPLENVVVQNNNFPITSNNQLQNMKPIGKYINHSLL